MWHASKVMMQLNYKSETSPVKVLTKILILQLSINSMIQVYGTQYYLPYISRELIFLNV